MRRIACCPTSATVIADMRERDALGRERYGVPLQSDNGRNAMVDAYQEALDLVAYLKQVEVESLTKREWARGAYYQAMFLAADIRAKMESK